jgi:hypothetical protein
MESFQRKNRPRKGMKGLLVNPFLIFLVLVFSNEIWADPVDDFSLPIDESVKRKLDPSILMELKSLRKEEQLSKPLKILARTKSEIIDSQAKQIKEAGLIIGSILGDIFTATGPLMAVLKIASFDFVIYIELSRELKQK